MDTDQFINYCLKLAEQHRGDSSHQAAAVSIRDAGNRLTGRVHPMITQIAILTQDLAEGFLPIDDQRLDWDRLCQTVQRYATNQWEPTTWTLLATYSVFNEHGRAVSAINVRVDRIQGKSSISTANDALCATISKLERSIDSRQTDEWYLRNLARLLPVMVGELAFTGVGVQEMLL